jgi:lipoprotein NlpD
VGRGRAAARVTGPALVADAACLGVSALVARGGLAAAVVLGAFASGGCGGFEAEAPRTSRIRVVSVSSAGASPSARIGAGPCADMAWPVDGVLSSTFGQRDGRPHEGIDLAVGEDTPVRAACDGVVAYAGDRLRGYGRLVILEHGAGLTTVYAHNHALRVREGERVAKGGVIALSGQTGHATAPHVHFEVRQDSRPRDPLEYLPPRTPARVATQARRARR